MFVELYLAGEAFALHLLLQYPEGLVDIVVTDENLHAIPFRFRDPDMAMGRFRSQWQL